MGSVPGSGRFPGAGNGNPLQHSWLENSMDRGNLWAAYRPWGQKESDKTMHSPESSAIEKNYIDKDCLRHAMSKDEQI